MVLSQLSLSRFLVAVGLLSVSVGLSAVAWAGLFGGGFGNQAVGGVLIEPNGTVRVATEREKRQFADLVREGVDAPAADLANATERRMISLAGLQEAILEADQNGQPVPDEVELLAGLQRIDYVFVDPANNDLVLCGPAEPWIIAADGSVVGTRSGQTPLRLIDLATALQTIEAARTAGISCSIEPTPEGRRRLQSMLRNIKLAPGQNPAIFEAAMKEAFGPQQILLNGVPNDSRFARVMVASDFEMKRVAMGLVESPVRELPSYLAMARNAAQSASTNPRWWMACDYEAIAKTDDELAWMISGGRVKTLTETDLVGRDGNAQATGRKDRLAQDWADLMNEHYADLARAIPAFSDLSNLMDLTVVATLIEQQGLDRKAGLDLTLLRGGVDAIRPISYVVPESVDPQCSFIRGRRGWVVTASGGVDINPFDVVANQTVDAGIDPTRTESLAARADRWFWDAEN